jgi:hypothetical protein
MLCAASSTAVRTMSAGQQCPAHARADEFNAALLRPPLPVSPEAQAAALPPAVKAILVLEAESDFRALERDLRELDTLEKRGIAGAGSLQGAYSRQGCPDDTLMAYKRSRRSCRNYVACKRSFRGQRSSTASSKNA